uniref:Fe2OG dioxygenase domain-containing protein n=1 Tax=Chrysotila carterae TaxID=13221 RepID=A0A7S4B8E0_CHRCT
MWCSPQATIAQKHQLSTAANWMIVLVYMLAACCSSSISMAAGQGPRDNNERCQAWASTGECDANPQFMLSECALSCMDASASVSQIRKECAGYADMGECSRNPAFMLATCRRECEAWEAKAGVKMDLESRCVEWSMLGRCLRDAEYMSRTCNTSCTIQQQCNRTSFTGWSLGICDKALRCEPTDKRDDCAALAQQGKCREDPQRMAQVCLSTCAAQDIDGVLSAQRPNQRARLTPYIDVPSELSRKHERCWIPGWSGHNLYKLMLPTKCAAPPLPWRRKAFSRSDAEDLLTCPIDVRRQTPRVPIRSRNVTIEPHTPNPVLVQHVLASPRVRLLHNFITDAEGEALLKLAEPYFHRSPVRSVASDRRTSSTATIGTRGAVIEAVRARISAFSGYDDHMLEPLQIVRYHAGEKYEPHHDLFDICDFPQKPRRQLTFLIYLNDMPDEAGGHTTFPRMHLQIQPRKNMALVFNDVLDNGMDDERTEHGGSPPSSGIKYAINCWIRDRAIVNSGYLSSFF